MHNACTISCRCPAAPGMAVFAEHRSRYTRGIDSRVLAHVIRPPIAAVSPACDNQREYVKAQVLARAA